MLHVLPTEVTLSVLSHLPIPSLLSLPLLSRQWFDLFTANQSVIFHGAALSHEYIQPGTLCLEDALSVNTGRPWAGSTSWRDFCHRSFQLDKNWEGKGRAVVRVLTPQGSNDHCIKVDEKAGICITTRLWGGLTVTHLFSGTVLWCLPMYQVRSSADCEYDNGYLIFDHEEPDHGEHRHMAKEVWRLASDFAAEGEVAAHAPPNAAQMRVSAHAAEVYHHYAPRGQFRPWALLRLHEFTYDLRLAYPTLICANYEHAFLHDVRTGSLLQTIDLHLRTLSNVDVNEHHAFACEQDVVHVFSRESGSEVLRIPADATVRCSQRVEDPFLVCGDKFITPISVFAEVDESPRPKFIAAHVSRDGRDLVILSERHRVVFIRDFERIRRGETSFKRAGLVLGIRPEDVCCYLDFKHGRVCVATIEGLYIFFFGPELSAKAVFVRPSKVASARSRPNVCVQLTDRRIYLTWEDSRSRQDIPLFEDAENAEELTPPTTPTFDLEFEVPAVMGQWMGRDTPFDSHSVGCVDFTLMPESFASEI